MDTPRFLATFPQSTIAQVIAACTVRGFKSPRLAVDPSGEQKLCLVVTPAPRADIFDMVALEDDLEAILHQKVLVVSERTRFGAAIARDAVAL
jgi:hypothetical protein